jgi:hypothetical protein
MVPGGFFPIMQENSTKMHKLGRKYFSLIVFQLAIKNNTLIVSITMAKAAFNKTREDGTYTLCRNVGKQLPHDAA